MRELSGFGGKSFRKWSDFKLHCWHVFCCYWSLIVWRSSWNAEGPNSNKSFRGWNSSLRALQSNTHRAASSKCQESWCLPGCSGACLVWALPKYACFFFLFMASSFADSSSLPQETFPPEMRLNWYLWAKYRSGCVCVMAILVPVIFTLFERFPFQV